MITDQGSIIIKIIDQKLVMKIRKQGSQNNDQGSRIKCNAAGSIDQLSRINNQGVQVTTSRHQDLWFRLS